MASRVEATPTRNSLSGLARQRGFLPVWLRASDLWVQASVDYKAATAAVVLPEKNRVQRKSIQSNRRNGTTFQLLGAV